MTDSKSIVLKTPLSLTALSALDNAIEAWANATTSATTPIRANLIQNKTRDVGRFFAWIGKPPQSVTAADIAEYRMSLEAMYRPATVYATLSRVSSFYNWVRKEPTLAALVPANPVALARPKAPRQYESESTKSLDDEQVQALLAFVKQQSGLPAKRDYALLLFYFLTGMRRQEIAALKRGDVDLRPSGVRFTTRVKGGALRTMDLKHPKAKAALLSYINASGRAWNTMAASDRLWLRHDRGGVGKGVTSWGIVKSLKRYCTQLGFSFHLHQTRHTFARVVADETGSLTDTQSALGHSQSSTTRVYIQRVGVSQDKHSDQIGRRFKI